MMNFFGGRKKKEEKKIDILEGKIGDVSIYQYGKFKPTLTPSSSDFE
jgi:hypothetical protein